jgi:CspA family cold shock protein
MATGKVKFYSKNEGYGFIIEAGTKREIFFHHSGMIDKYVKQGDEVIFDIEMDDEDHSDIVAFNVKKG